MQEMQETRVLSMDGEDPLEKEMATRSSIFAWKIPWTKEPGGLQSIGLQRVRHDSAHKGTHTHIKVIAQRGTSPHAPFPFWCTHPDAASFGHVTLRGLHRKWKVKVKSLREAYHGILQARILEWVTTSFSRGSSRPRDQTQVSRIGGRRFNLWAIGPNSRICFFLVSLLLLNILKIFAYLSWITVYLKLLASFTTPIYRAPIDALGQALLYLLSLFLLSWLQPPLPCIVFLRLWTTLFRSFVLFLPILPSSLETLQFLFNVPQWWAGFTSTCSTWSFCFTP